jgi:Zn-dependent protease
MKQLNNALNFMEDPVNFEKLNPEDQLKYCRKFVQESKYENEISELVNIINEAYFASIEENPKKWRKTLASAGLSLITLYLSFNFDSVLAFVLFITLSIHELGHFILQKKYSFKNVTITFYGPIGAAVSGVSKNNSASENFWMYIMGPLPGLIISFFIFLFLNFFSQESSDSLITNLHFFAVISLYINAFNLFPGGFLDGAKIFSVCFDKFPRFSWVMNIVLSILLLLYLSSQVYDCIIRSDIPGIVIIGVLCIALLWHFKSMLNSKIPTINRIANKTSQFLVERYGEIPNVIDYDIASYIFYQRENCERNDIYIHEVFVGVAIPPNEFQRKVYVMIYFSLIAFTWFMFYYFLK